MSPRTIGALSAHNLRLIRRDPGPIVVMTVVPIGLMAFLAPGYESQLTSTGYPGAKGGAQAVPGMVIMFAFFWHAYAGVGFFEEYGWGTWDRLRATSARPSELVAGKVLAPFLLALVQLSVLFAAGTVVVDLDVRAELLPAIGALIVGLAGVSISIAVALASISRTLDQVNALGNITAILLSGVGGALMPIALLPHWAETIAPATPTYWAARGFRELLLEGEGPGAAVVPTLVMLAFAAGFMAAGVAGMRRLRRAEAGG